MQSHVSAISINVIQWSVEVVALFVGAEKARHGFEGVCESGAIDGAVSIADGFDVVGTGALGGGEDG